MEVVLLIIRILLFGVFAIAGVGKLLDLGGSEKAIRAFGVPTGISRAAAIVLPVIELIIASLLLFEAISWFGAVSGLGLLAVFTVGMLWQMKKGNAPDCHCFGQLHSEPVGMSSVIRNLIIAALACVLIAYGRANQGISIGDTNASAAQNIVILALAVAVVIAAGYLRDLRRENSRISRRIDLLELLENGGQPLERNEAGDPTDSLPIGAQFPDFELLDTKGRVVNFEHLLSDYRPKLFVFVGPKCEPCKSLIPSFLEWKKEFDGKLRLIFVSSGTAEENTARFGEEIAADMLLQKNKELAKKIYAKWTPSAAFVSAEGNLAGHLVVGDAAMIDLVDRLRSEDLTSGGFFYSSPRRPGRVKIGQEIPPFTLADLDGRVVTKEDLMGSRTLAVFLSTTCSFCAGVAEQLREWEGLPENDIKAVVFSEGDRSANKEFGLSSPVLLEDGYSTAVRIGMFGVPSGVLIDENGVIISETATGGPAIWSLVGKYS